MLKKTANKNWKKKKRRTLAAQNEGLEWAKKIKKIEGSKSET